MNDARQISALLTAINKCFPTLIICQSSSIPKWHYEFSKASLSIITADELSMLFYFMLINKFIFIIFFLIIYYEINFK